MSAWGLQNDSPRRIRTARYVTTFEYEPRTANLAEAFAVIIRTEFGQLLRRDETMLVVAEMTENAEGGGLHIAPRPRRIVGVSTEEVSNMFPSISTAMKSSLSR